MVHNESPDLTVWILEPPATVVPEVLELVLFAVFLAI